MISVSADFLAAAIATTRKPKARAKVTWTDPFRDLSMTASANDVNRVDLTAQTYDLVESMSRKWFHADGITTLANAPRLMPASLADATANDLQVGWFGATRCDGSGDFAGPLPALTIEFDERPITEILVVGDDKYVEYPVDFTVKLYSGVSLLHTETVTGNTDLRFVQDISSSGIFDADKAVLTISKWSTVNRVVKITEFFSVYATTYDGDDILSLSLLEEMETADGSLPIGNISSSEIDIKFQNTDDLFNPFNTSSPIYAVIKRNRKIEPELGFELDDGSIEYVSLGVFWSGDWSVPEQDAYASTAARDRLDLLRKSIYSTSTVQEDTTLYALAVAVLEDAKLQMPDLDYDVDTALSSITVPNAWLNRQSHRSAIRKIVEAAGGRAYCNRDGEVVIVGPEDIAGSSVLSVTKDNYFTKLQPAKTEEIANQVDVKILPLLAPDATSEIYRSNTPLTASTVQVKYNEPPIIDASAKAYEYTDMATTTTSAPPVEYTITDANYYAWGADFTVNNSGNPYIIVIQGKRLAVSGEEVVTSEDSDSVDELGELKYEFPENELIQSRTTGQTIADNLVASYATERRDIDLNWRGNPALELVDIITAPLYGVTTDTFYTIRNQLNYDGALSAQLGGRLVTGTTTTTVAP